MHTQTHNACFNVRTSMPQVGADINLAANVSWRKDLLAFVPGLGPRKAQALLQVRELVRKHCMVCEWRAVV